MKFRHIVLANIGAALICVVDPAFGQSSVDVATSSFSSELCSAVDPAAIADIPKAASGFTGHESSTGNWLAAPAESPLKGKRVALSVLSLGLPFMQAVKTHWQHLADKYGFELKVYDGRFDPGTVQKLVDDIISDMPDAVAFAPFESNAAVNQVKRLQDAGLPVVTYNVQPSQVVSPRVFADDYTGPMLVGCNTAKYYKAKFGDKPALLGIVDLPQVTQVQDRKNGFIYGFKSVIPSAKVMQTVDGGGVMDKGNIATGDLLQAHPEINVIFGINDGSAIGALAALKAIGEYSPEWGVMASIDGSEPIMGELGSKASPLKAEGGYPPYDFAMATFNLLGATVAGKTDKNTQVVVTYPSIAANADAIKAWLDHQYPR